MAYNAVNIASNIINKMREKNLSLDHIKLQKLLYFFAVEYFSINREPVFEQPIEKWKLGPVVRDVYNEYKFKGSSEINEPTYKFTFSHGRFTSSIIEPANLNEDDNVILDEIIDKYGGLPSFRLVDITHEEDVWKEAKPKIERREDALFYTTDDFKRIVGRRN
ncbi:type II toxin-antitoxin system antitoxin SocA domain-containing protein [Lysinibacillus sp.]|uniref:Panacea domain-containing protein n=1 Tax=Lysinibacillus sp. TaxID=1869345 RepID=UPI0028AF8E93|nr:type II toxin-antitoxin system antitoxin SocA domain-containing protein [Lysinibacillus sp.]